jgi:adenylate kinase
VQEIFHRRKRGLGLDNYQVVYLTGAPASGKSSLVKYLLKTCEPLKAFIYGEELTKYISSKELKEITQDQIRSSSAQIITREDVTAVDSNLLRFVTDNRNTSNIIIDSHAVTKEKFGFRVTSFTLDQLKQLDPTMICVLYTEASVAIDRIRANHQGRPSITPFEADFHSQLQASVALIYSIQLGIPIYFFDSDKPTETLGDEVLRRLQK